VFLDQNRLSGSGLLKEAPLFQGRRLGSADS
jgi:hypothetical protein